MRHISDTRKKTKPNMCRKGYANSMSTVMREDCATCLLRGVHAIGNGGANCGFSTNNQTNEICEIIACNLPCMVCMHFLPHKCFPCRTSVMLKVDPYNLSTYSCMFCPSMHTPSTPPAAHMLTFVHHSTPLYLNVHRAGTSTHGQMRTQAPHPPDPPSIYSQKITIKYVHAEKRLPNQR